DPGEPDAGGRPAGVRLGGGARPRARPAVAQPVPRPRASGAGAAARTGAGCGRATRGVARAGSGGFGHPRSLSPLSPDGAARRRAAFDGVVRFGSRRGLVDDPGIAREERAGASGAAVDDGGGAAARDSLEWVAVGFPVVAAGGAPRASV